MKKLLSILLICFVVFTISYFGFNIKGLFADSVTINMVTSIRGGGWPNYLDGAIDVEVEGNYAFVVSYSDDAFTIFDISNPANPVHVAQFTGRGPPNKLYGPYSIFIQGDYAYIASHSNNALTIFNISDPRNPYHVGSIEGLQGNAPYLYGANDVFVSGNYAYVTSRYDDALTIIDVGNPANPTYTGSIRGAGTPNYLNGASTVHVQGNYAYVTATLDSSLTIIDVSNPVSPKFVSSIRGNGTANFLDDQMDAYVSGNYAYAVCLNEDSFTVIDVANPLNPQIIGEITHNDYYVWLGGAYSVIVQGDYAYIGGRTKDSLVIINVNDPTNPVHKKSVRSVGNPYYISGASGIDVEGNYVYLTGPGDDSLSIFNIDITGDEKVGEFVNRFYTLCLERTADPDGMEYWVGSLASDQKTGEDIGYGFVMSDEYKAKSTSDTDFVTMLYNVFLGRPPDPGGLSFWTEQLTRATRPGVLNGFIHSAEFSSICDSYGITAYKKGLPGFVNRFYALTLERLPDSQGLSYWVDLLSSGDKTGADIAYGFVFSNEFISKNHSNAKYISILYNAFFDRVPDQDGFNYWTGLLNGGATRQYILDRFIASQEFIGICNSYGIKPY